MAAGEPMMLKSTQPYYVSYRVLDPGSQCVVRHRIVVVAYSAADALTQARLRLGQFHAGPYFAIEDVEPYDPMKYARETAADQIVARITEAQ